jgi:hypothetical protein
LIGLPHDNGGCAAVQDRRDDPAVEDSEPVVVLGTRVNVATVESSAR